MKIWIILLMVLGLQAKTPVYDVNFRGMTLGEVRDLSTIKDLYLNAKVTSRVARFLLGENRLVYYGGDKPNIGDAKFKKDKKMILYAFSQSLDAKPKFKRFTINENKNITLACEKQECTFIYYRHGEVGGEGKISFDEQGNFLRITEEMSNFEIVKQ